MARTSPPAIRVQDLTVVLDHRTILDNLSFVVPAGETTAIIGPNGAGKSVLLKAILRLIPKTAGTVEIFDTPHAEYRQVASRLSYVPQRLSFANHFPLTVNELFNLKSSRLLGMRTNEKERMDELLERVGMSHTVNQQLSTLSGGQIQRVLLAYSLIDQPDLLILDEPSAGIDIHGQETIYALLRRIQAEEKLTLLLVSHELEIVTRYASQVLCLNKKLLCAGLPQEVLSSQVLEEMYGTPMGQFHHHHD